MMAYCTAAMTNREIRRREFRSGAVLRPAAFAAGEMLPDERGHADGDADRGDEEDEEDRAAERYGGQRRGVAAAVAADHEVVGDLREDLSHLGQHDGQRQPQIGAVLSLYGRNCTCFRFGR